MWIDTLSSWANTTKRLMDVTTRGTGSMSTWYSVLVTRSTWSILASSAMGTKALRTQSTTTSRRPRSSSVRGIGKFTLANTGIQLTNTCTSEWQERTMKVYLKIVRRVISVHRGLSCEDNKRTPVRAVLQKSQGLHNSVHAWKSRCRRCWIKIKNTHKIL